MKRLLRILKHSRRFTRWCIVVALFCALGGGSVGFPSVRQVAKDHSQPFPCQDRACGCMNAESCWRKCCCHTNKQKLAWARKNGVTPPAYVFIAAAAEDGDSQRMSCCQKREHDVAGAARSCERPPEAKPAAQETRTEFAVVFVDSFRKCQGQSHHWNSLCDAVLPVWPALLTDEPGPCGWLALFSESSCSISMRPAAPPPRA